MSSDEKLEARIVVGEIKGGRRCITVVDVRSGRVIDTGLNIWPHEVDDQVRSLKNTLERAGNRVSVKVM